MRRARFYGMSVPEALQVRGMCTLGMWPAHHRAEVEDRQAFALTLHQFRGQNMQREPHRRAFMSAVIAICKLSARIHPEENSVNKCSPKTWA